MVPELAESRDRGLTAIALFNAGEFFAAHEAWEGIWVAEAPPRKLFLQGLIHLAVAFHHHRAGNAPGTERQMRKGLRKLAAYLPVYDGIDTWALYHACAEWDGTEAYPHITHAPERL